ncbi:MAG: PilZ domain-containing protein [Marinicaulis sp.]|nr:PilZ domain-containing protein [Marinicaulis sp.]
MLARRKKIDQDEEQRKIEELKARLSARLTRVAEKPAPENAPKPVSLGNLNTRDAQRIKTDSPAIVVCEADQDTPAQIVDISKTGLRLRFAKPHYLPEMVLLDAPAFTGFVVSIVMWQDGNEAGVKFDTALTKKIAPIDEKREFLSRISTADNTPTETSD